MDIDSAGGLAGMTSALQQQTMGAQVITKTLENINQAPGGQADADFQTKVLAAAGKGGNLDLQV